MQQPATANVLRAFTFWIRSHLRDECNAYLESTRLKELRSAPGIQRAAAVFRDLGDGTTEVVVMSVWDSMESILAFAGIEPMKPIVETNIQHKLFDREPTVRHYSLTDRSALDLLPPEWRQA